MMGGQGIITGVKHPVMLAGATIAKYKLRQSTVFFLTHLPCTGSL
jgi:hypothetical protein